MGRLFRRVFAWCVLTEGSSRSSALIRIFLVLIVWTRWGSELVLFRNLETPARLVLSLSYFASTTMMLLGVFSRTSTMWVGLTTLTMYYHFGVVLGREPWTHHHTYLLAIGAFLCAFTPCGRSYSLDRWWALRRAEKAGLPPPREWGNLWGLRLIAIQLSLVYFYSAYNKTPGFFDGDRMEGFLLRYYLGSDLPRWPGFHEMMAVIGTGTVLLEYALAVGMLFAVTRRWLVIPGLLLHAGFYVLLPIVTFSATMFLLYLAYFDADTIHRVIDRLSGNQFPSRSAGTADT